MFLKNTLNLWFSRVLQEALAVTLCMVLFVFTACSSQVVISSELSAPELIQRAQEASDRNRYKVSLQYYEAVLERYAFNPEYICEAEYEIAFIKYKQKDYTAAKTGLSALLKRYDNQDAEFLPQHFRILANIVLGKIDASENQRKK